MWVVPNISKYNPFRFLSSTIPPTGADDTIGDLFPEIHGEPTQDTDALPNPDDESMDKPPIYECRPCPTTIKHIVISGGGEYGFAFYKALRESHNAGFWNLENIQTVYGSSVGALFATIISLVSTVGFDTFDDFLLNRPWHKVFDFHINKLLQMVKTKGIFGKSLVYEIVAPVFHSIDIPLDINMKDFYEFTKVELHLIASNLATFDLVDISYKTHPEWTVVDAMYSSLGLPILFIPNIVGENIYADGGFVNNYPTNLCIQNGAEPDEILGLIRINPIEKHEIVLNTLIDYILFILGSAFTRVLGPHTNIKNQIEFEVSDQFVNIYKIHQSTSMKTRRIELFDIGTNAWNAFYTKTYPDIPTSVEAPFEEESMVQ